MDSECMMQKRLKATNEPLYNYHRSENVSRLNIVDIFYVIFLGTKKNFVYTYLQFDKQRWSLTITKQLDITIIYRHTTQRIPRRRGSTCNCLFLSQKLLLEYFLRLSSRCLMEQIDVCIRLHSFRQKTRNKKKTFFIFIFPSVQM